MPNSDPSIQRFLRRTLVSLSVTIILPIVLILLPAWDIGWGNAWIFILVFVVLTIVSVFYLWYANPEIFVARSKIQAGTKWWDRLILYPLTASLVAIFPVAGFDHRFHWSSVPAWLAILGYVLFTLGYIASDWVYSVNKFAELGVRIQTDRGQTVIDTGPYGFVRHPLYLAGLFLIGGIPLALGSFWALIPFAVGAILLIVRTALEDRMLQEELEGYKEYASRIRYRLIPGVW
jgi:protein-S-isoprenylcysteine O-methyltransferase Ste14